MIVWLRRAVEHRQITDDRITDRVERVQRLVQEPVSTRSRSFSPSASSRRTTFSSRANSLGSNFDVLHGVRDQLDGHHHVLGRRIDVEHRHVGAGEGVGRPPKLLMISSISLLACVGGGAAGHDVLQHVAQAGPVPAALEGAAGVLDKAPHRGHGGHVVLLHQHRQAVGQRGQRYLVGKLLDAGDVHRGRFRRRLAIGVALAGPPAPAGVSRLGRGQKHHQQPHNPFPANRHPPHDAIPLSIWWSGIDRNNHRGDRLDSHILPKGYSYINGAGAKKVIYASTGALFAGGVTEADKPSAPGLQWVALVVP